MAEAPKIKVVVRPEGSRLTLMFGSLRLSHFAVMMLVAMLSGVGCTNYSSREQVISPPVILSITREDSGHIITISAQNQEIGFSGYRLYTGVTEDLARSENSQPVNLLQCLNVITDSPVQYIIEVKPDRSSITPVEGENRICIITAGLTAGEWVAMRSLLFKDFSTFDTSISSNAAVIP